MSDIQQPETVTEANTPPTASDKGGCAELTGSEVQTPRTNNLLMQMKLTPEYTKEKETDRDRALYLCRCLERELAVAIKALDELHIVCETSKPEIFDWYLRDQFAAEARQNAITVLLTARAAGLPNDEASNRPA